MESKEYKMKHSDTEGFIPEGGFHYAKYLLFGLNFLTFALGAFMLAMSLWVRSDSGLWVYTENLTIERYYWACYFGMAAGGLLFLISLLGCMGALMDSRMLFQVHALLALIALVCEVTLLVFVFRNPGGDRLQNELAYELKYHIDVMEFSARSRNFLDLIQLKLQCCGAYSFIDYKNMQLQVPQSCSSDLTNNINYRSCGEMLRRYLEIRGGIMGGLGLALVLLQLVTTGLSIAYTKFNKRTKLSI